MQGVLPKNHLPFPKGKNLQVMLQNSTAVYYEVSPQEPSCQNVCINTRQFVALGMTLTADPTFR